MMAVQTMSVHQELRLRGGLTRSVFPRVEAWLDEDGDRYEVVRALLDQTEVEYRSAIDLLFCETFRQQRAACLSFYQRKGKPLRKLYGTVELRMFERGLLYACRIAYERFVSDRLGRWAAIAGATQLYLLED
jgi:hypothetical protein